MSRGRNGGYVIIINVNVGFVYIIFVNISLWKLSYLVILGSWEMFLIILLFFYVLLKVSSFWC